MSDVSVKITGFDRIIFNKRELKAAIRKGGNEVKREAQRLISRKSVSMAGDFPGLRTGVMKKSIKVKLGSGGGYAKVMPYKTSGMKAFYPAFLNYGSSRGLKPRKNFMTAALDARRSQIQSAFSASLQNALKAG